MGVASASGSASYDTAGSRSVHTPATSRKRKLDPSPTAASAYDTPGSSWSTPICLDDDDDRAGADRSQGYQKQYQSRQQQHHGLQHHQHHQHHHQHHQHHEHEHVYYEPDETLIKQPSKKRSKRSDKPAQEKRLRRHRAQPPQTFYDIFTRATTQPFYILERTRCGTQECPEEMVEIAGTTGNIYYVCIAQLPTCDCPHARKGNQCKHLLYVMSRVLRAPFEYVYQLALLSSELREIFDKAPPIASDLNGNTDTMTSGHRKPIEDEDCPICFSELAQPGVKSEDSLVWCRAACGQNMHKQCFEMWAATKRRSATGIAGGDVTCPMCRSVWQGDDEVVKKIKKTGKANAEGYINVADQLGISTHRDTSSYSRWWSGFGGPRGRGRQYY